MGVIADAPLVEFAQVVPLLREHGFGDDRPNPDLNSHHHNKTIRRRACVAAEEMKMNMNKLAFAAAIALGPLALVACNRDAPTDPIEPRIVASGGNAQAGYVDSVFPSAFVVQVNDRTRKGVPDVRVEWTITSGAGELVNVKDEGPFTLTDARGFASVSVRPTVLGAITVTASTAAVPGVLATFTAFARKAPDIVIHIQPGLNCGDPSTFRGPDGSSDVTVPVGALVEWVYAESYSSTFPCMAVVQSDTVPVGGTPFVGLLNGGDLFQFVPKVAGTWEYGDVNNGGRGTLTARAP